MESHDAKCQRKNTFWINGEKYVLHATLCSNWDSNCHLINTCGSRGPANGSAKSNRLDFSNRLTINR